MADFSAYVLLISCRDSHGAFTIPAQRGDVKDKGKDRHLEKKNGRHQDTMNTHTHGDICSVPVVVCDWLMAHMMAF